MKFLLLFSAIASVVFADRLALPDPFLDLEVVLPERAPPCYFQYQNGNNTNLPPRLIRELMKGKEPGAVMIGGDPGLGNMPGDEGFWAAMKAAETAKARKHVYLMGPGGPTGTSGVEGELWKRMERAARAEGININSAEGLVQWNRDGWKKHLFKQLKYFNGANPSKIHMDSFEIDNLYRAKLTGKALIAFYKELQAWLSENKIEMTILPKNLSSGEWTMIGRAIRDGVLKRNLFSDFAIQEVDDVDAKTADRQRSEAAALGITVVDSRNTYDYRAHGGSCAPRKND